jgi:hypothetical protein
MSTNKTKTLFFLVSLLLAFGLAGNVKAANFPLEITNIKPAGTGTPAIPATNRIFRAYPGIEYNIRAAVIGGTYPYTYSLSNAPEGMTINSRTGEIVWPNPQSDAINVQLSVKDSENTTVSTTWSIAVSTNGFLFVDASYSGVETGSFEQPFSSISSLMNNTAAGNREDIVYFREGSYMLVAFNTGSNHINPGGITGKYGTYLTQRPYKWIGFPDESVNINADVRYIAHNSTAGIYFDNLNLSNFSDYGIRAYGGANYAVVRRCNWSNIVAVRSDNENFGFYFAAEWPANSPGKYLTFQDNTFSERSGAAGIGSLYITEKVLIENNDFFGNVSSGLSGITTCIAAKYATHYITIRGNLFRTNGGSAFGTSMNGTFIGSSNIEFLYNLFYRGDGDLYVNERINMRTDYGGTNYFHFYRNAIVGNLTFDNLDGNNCENGPWNLYNNVIINPATADPSSYTKVDHIQYRFTCSNNPQNCINDNYNLKGTQSDNIIGSNGKLSSSHQQYLGTHGWQFSDGSTPMDKTTSLPANPIPGDINKDGVVNIFDYNIFLQHFGVTNDCQNVADLNGDCLVNIFDYNILLTNFGRTQ